MIDVHVLDSVDTRFDTLATLLRAANASPSRVSSNAQVKAADLSIIKLVMLHYRDWSELEDTQRDNLKAVYRQLNVPVIFYSGGGFDEEDITNEIPGAHHIRSAVQRAAPERLSGLDAGDLEALIAFASLPTGATPSCLRTYKPTPRLLDLSLCLPLHTAVRMREGSAADKEAILEAFETGSGASDRTIKARAQLDHISQSPALEAPDVQFLSDDNKSVERYIEGLRAEILSTARVVTEGDLENVATLMQTVLARQTKANDAKPARAPLYGEVLALVNKCLWR